MSSRCEKWTRSDFEAYISRHCLRQFGLNPHRSMPA